MPKLRTVKVVKKELERLNARIGKLIKQRDKALKLAEDLQRQIDGLLEGGAGGRRPGRKPGPKPGAKRRRPRKKAGRPRKTARRGRPPKGGAKMAARKTPAKSGPSFHEVTKEIVVKAGGIALGRLAQEVAGRGFRFKNTKRLILMQLKKMGLKKDGKGNITA
jgi:hypothetical protein